MNVRWVRIYQPIPPLAPTAPKTISALMNALQPLAQPIFSPDTRYASDALSRISSVIAAGDMDRLFPISS